IADRAVPDVVGYANGSIGYICTAQAHKEGGYEPNNSQSGPGAEEILVTESLKLADRVVGDVFESFASACPAARTGHEPRVRREVGLPPAASAAAIVPVEGNQEDLP